MDVDQSNSLKRCSSAPQINNILQQEQVANAIPAPVAEPTANVAREPPTVPSSFANILTPRARRFSTSFNPLTASPSSKLVPRISQIRQEELEVPTQREVNHEREVHSAMQISQSYEDLTLITETWSFKGDQDTNSVSNLLHLNLTNSNVCCSSPSPTRSGMRLPYGLSPSPTRKSFATRRSMSPIAMRPSQLASSVKRKFELDDPTSTYSPPPFKKLIIDRNPSPSFRQTPSPLLCPSPDSCASSYEGRTTPKCFVSKLFTSNLPSTTANSVASSPATTELSSETDTPSEMDCGTNITPPQSNKSSCVTANGVELSSSTEENSMESGISSTMEFKEPDKCDSRVVMVKGATVKIDGIVPCDSTSHAQLKEATQSDVVTKKEHEKMTVDEGSCG
ncbi:P2R1A-PPP2R2A-interacting phosphatase regulator 1 [Culicoides brevitarsis]|uniref:P2R1A-PPP2R2A-interacting phosphatase regulator 1 n=1 Tax=Culicoides brevitarsis TaxID=469753 RepID=UPI00307BAB77